MTPNRLLFIRSHIRTTVIHRRTDLSVWRSKRRRPSEEMEILDQKGGDAVIVNLQGDLFFGTTDQLFSEIEKDLATKRYLLLDFRRVDSMDYTAAHLFEQMSTRLQARGGELLFSGMPSNLPTSPDIAHYLAQLGVVREGGGIRVFEMRDSALEWMEARILESAGWTAQESDPPLDLGDFELLSGFAPDQLTMLLRTVREVSLPEGGAIFGQGAMGEEMYFVRRGRVHILLPLEGGKKHHLATFCRGDFFGEIAFLDRGPRSARAEADTEVDLYVLTRSAFDSIGKDNPLLASSVFEHLALVISERLRVANVELRSLEER